MCTYMVLSCHCGIYIGIPVASRANVVPTVRDSDYGPVDTPVAMFVKR